MPTSRSSNKKAPALPRYIPVGEIRRPHGLLGKIKAALYNDQSDLIFSLDTVYLGTQAEQLSSFKVNDVQPMNDGVLLSLDSVDTVDQVNSLRGQKIWIESDQLPKLASGEFFHFQIIGLDVWSATEQRIGKAVGVESNVGADILVVERADGKRHLIPMTRDAIKKISLADQKILLNNLEGLLDDPF